MGSGDAPTPPHQNRQRLAGVVRNGARANDTPEEVGETDCQKAVEKILEPAIEALKLAYLRAVEVVSGASAYKEDSSCSSRYEDSSGASSSCDPRKEALTTTQPDPLSSSAQPRAETETAQKPEPEPGSAPAPEPGRMPDEEFAANMTRIFVENGKDNPTHKQIREVMDKLPNHPKARPEFLLTLQEKIVRLKHPGSLPFVVEGFNAKWPQLLKMLEAESQPGGKRQRSLSRSDEVRSHLHKNVEALRQAGCPEVADQVEDMAAGPLDDEEDVERRLGILEQKMIEILRGRQSEQDAIAAHKSLKSQLSPYRSKMTADQLAMLERQYLDRDLLEKAKIPRLSLFYL